MDGMGNGSNFDAVYVCMYGICVWVYTSPFVFFGLALGYPRDFVSKFQAVLYLVVYNAPALRV